MTAASLKQIVEEALAEVGANVNFLLVPKGKARIRTQMSAAHSVADVDEAIDAFARVGRAMGLVA